MSARDFLQLDAVAREAHLRSLGSPEPALVRFGDECESAASGDPSGAAAMLHELRMACGEGPRFASARARASRAEVLSLAYLGRFDDAIRRAESARADAQAHGAHVEAARIRLAAMQPLLKVGRHDDALAEGQMASSELAAHGAASLAARAHINIGNVLKAMSRPDGALDHLDRALEMVAGDAALAATISNTRGEALMQLDRFAEAHDAFAAAIAHFAAQSQSFAWAVAEGNLADLAARTGDLSAAFEHFASARARLPQQAAGHAARLLLEEAEVFEASGLGDIAAERLSSARAALDALGMPLESRRAALAASRMAIGRGEFADALSAVRGIPEPAAPGTGVDLPVLAVRALALAGIAALTDDGAMRSEALESAAQLAREVDAAPDSVQRIVAADHLAQAHDWLGRHDDALAAARRAADSAGRVGLATLVGAACSTHARLARRAGHFDEAVDAAQRAVAATERTRASFGADRLRSAFLGSRLAPYEQLILSLIQRGGPGSAEEAFAAAELARSRTLIDRLFAAVPAADGDSDPETVRLRDRLKGLHARLAAAAGDDARGAVTNPIRLQLIEAESLLERRLTERAVRSASNPAAPHGHAAESWRSLLGPDAAFVEYVEAEGRLLAFVATRDSIQVIPLAESSAHAADAVAKLHFRIRRHLRVAGQPVTHASTDVDPLLMRIGKQIWMPLKNAIRDARHIILAPCGALHAVPIAAVMSCCGDRDRTVSIAPSASVWAGLAARRTRDSAKAVLVVGIADSSAPRIADEVAAVADVLRATCDVRVLEGADATAEAVSAQLADPDVALAHLACHGQFIPAAPRASGLRLHDRWLSAREISSLPRTPHQVVLSGCETGASSPTPGEEVLGLPRAFLSRGTGTVVGSLWSVGDRDTSELMVDFYGRWGRVTGADRPSLATALASAQHARCKAHAHPAHWASFIAIGHDS